MYSYAEQIALVTSCAPSSILEIGAGNGFVSRALRAYGIPVTTVDIDPELKPDLVGSLLDLPVSAASYDLVMACQVLEHLPFDECAKCLSELRRVSVKHVLVSLPDSRMCWRLFVGRESWRRSGMIMVNGWSFSSRRQSKPEATCRSFGDYATMPWPKKHVFDGQHYWELGKYGSTVPQFLQKVREAGMSVVEHYRFPLNPYHHFFRLAHAEP
jgi:SAM-dependent methyltransferase